MKTGGPYLVVDLTSATVSSAAKTADPVIL